LLPKTKAAKIRNKKVFFIRLIFKIITSLKIYFKGFLNFLNICK